MENKNTETPISKKTIESFGSCSLVPGGNSMWPFLKNRGQSVIIDKYSGVAKKYDVIFYLRNGEKEVLHRILEDKGDYFIVCGDSQFNLEKVKKENVFGILNGFYKGKKFIKADNKKYLKKVDRWYSHPLKRKFILKIFFFSVRVKNHFFRKKRECSNNK